MSKSADGTNVYKFFTECQEQGEQYLMKCNVVSEVVTLETSFSFLNLEPSLITMLLIV